MGANISEQILAYIEQAVRDISFGSITLIVQDFRLIQMEKLEKIRLTELPKPENKTGPGNGIRTRIIQSVSGLEYGKVVIQIQSGKITQVERTEKYRVGKLTGLNGDGI